MSGMSSHPLLPSIIADHMVIQRDSPVPVWGWATPGTDVTVVFNGATRGAESDETGRWMVSLEPVAGPGPPRSGT